MSEPNINTIPNAATSPTAQDDDTIQRSPVRRQFSAAGIVLVLAVVAWFALSRASHPAANNDTPPPAAGDATTDAVTVTANGKHELRIRTEPAQLRFPDTTLATTGIVSIPVDRQMVVSPRLTGRIRKVFVDVGSRVQAGQVLATMDSVDAANAQTTAAEDRSKLDLATAELDRQRNLFRLGTPEVTSAQAALEQANENERFTKTALAMLREQAKIGGFTDKPLSDAQSAAKTVETQLAQDQKDLALAERQMQRTAQLVKIGIASAQDAEAAENSLGKARDAVANDTEQQRIARLTVAREQKAFDSRLYANQQLEQAETTYNQAVLQRVSAIKALAQAKAQVLRDLQTAQQAYVAAKSDAANAQNALILYGHPEQDGTLAVRAPIAGVVTQRNVNPDQVVDQSGSTPWQMFTIVNPGTVWVDADVHEGDLAGVATGDTVHITTDSLRGFSTSGRVIYITPGLDPKSHTTKVRTQVADSGGLLKDGMFVNISLQRAAKNRYASRVSVPSESIQRDGDRTFVLVADATDPNKYHKRYVHVGDPLGEDHVAVTDGLKAGESVVTQGALFLNDSGPGGD